MTSKTDFHKALSPTKDMDENSHLPIIFAITKKTIKGKRKFVVNKLKLDSVLIKSFFSSAKQKFGGIVKDLDKETTEIKDFFDDSITADDYSELDKDNVENLTEILQKIFQSRDDLVENDIKVIEKANFFAVRFKIGNKLIIYFTKFLSSNIITERNWISSAFYRGSFKNITGTMIVFPKKIDCIYIHSIKKLLIINKEYTEAIFDYYLYYEKNVDEFIKKLEVTNKIVTFDKKFIGEIKVTKQLPKKITKMLQDGKFEKTKEDFKEAKNLFEENPEWVGEFTKLEFDKQDLVEVRDKEQLVTVLGICDDSFAKSYLQNKDIFAITQKRLK